MITSWLQEGEMSKGNSTVEFNRAVSDARNDAERAVTEDRVPRQYHRSIEDYFRQLPESVREAQRAPAAPR